MPECVVGSDCEHVKSSATGRGGADGLDLGRPELPVAGPNVRGDEALEPERVSVPITNTSICLEFHIVCAGLGLTIDGESIPYVAGWGEDGALDAVNHFATTIDQIARQIENAIAGAVATASR